MCYKKRSFTAMFEVQCYMLVCFKSLIDFDILLVKEALQNVSYPEWLSAHGKSANKVQSEIYDTTFYGS